MHFFFSFEQCECWGGKQKCWWRLNRIELALCSSSGEVKSCCWFTEPGQQFCSTTRLQIASCRAAEGATAFSCQAANPRSFNFPNESSLITSCARAWFLSISSSINFKRQSRTWRWGGFSHNCWSDAVYLKESEGIRVYKLETDWWY